MDKTTSPNKTKSGWRKWLKSSLILIFLIAVFSVLWVEYQMRLVKGQFTQAIETTDILPLNGEYIIKNIFVLNPQGTQMLAGQDVIISDGKIKQLGQNLSHSPQLTVVEGNGSFMIPGLMDGHVHLSENPNNLMLYLANGVTHVRDMGGTDYHLNVRDEKRDKQLWPDLFVASNKVYTTPWYKAWFMGWTRSRVVMTDADKGVGIINDLKERGFDAVKISNELDPSHYESLVNAAHKADLLIVGHIPEHVPLKQFFTMGQQEIAHVEEITKAFEREYGLGIRDMNEITVAAYLDYVKTRSLEVAKIIKAKDIHVTSVIWLMESLSRQKLGLEEFLKTVELEYVDPAKVEGSPLTRGWLPGHHSYASSEYWLETPERRTQLKLYWDTYVDAIHIMTRVLVEEGIEFTAGTDSVVTGGVPGFSLHDELQSLVNTGMSPAQALQTATRTPGQWLSKVNKGAQTGQVKAGYKANLVLLRENPLDDINNSRSIESVIINGRLLNRSQLDQILNRIKSVNTINRVKDISEYK